MLRISSNCSSTDDFTQKYHPVNSQLPVYTILYRPLKLINRFLKSHLLAILQKGPVFKFFPLLKSLVTILKFQPNLIVTGPLPTTIVLYAKLFQKITASKLLINPSFHPTDPEFQNPIFLKILKSADYLWTLTDYETKYFETLGFKNIVQLGNGVDSSFLIKPKQITYPSKPNILYIGSFSAHKGIEELIEVFNQLPPNTTLTLAGQKTLYSPRLHLKFPRITTVIKPSDQEIKKLIDNCTVLVLPSHQESFGLVLIEAMARGKPVLVKAIPQLIELITKTQSGLIFNLSNTQLLLSSPRQFGLRGLKYISQRYTWDKIGENLCQKLSL